LTLPAEEGALPGGGALVNLLHVTTGVVPLVIGKPQRTMFDQALQHLNSHAANTVMVGDRYETDIIGAQRAGLRTVAVLTGVTQATELAVCDPPPDWIIPSIAEMGTLIWEVDNAV
jgi:4-nitrophenyl phosphatase